MRPALAALLLAGPLAAQYRGAHTADYQLVTSTADARSLWVNPGGLGVDLEASVTADVSADRTRDGSLKLNQITAGFNSRGIAFSYRRDAYNDTLSGHTYRVGAGRALDAIAVGFGLSFHSNGDGPTQRGLDVGVRYRLAPAIELAGVVREIGKPAVHGVLLDPNATAGIGIQLLSGFRLDGEGTITDVTGAGTTRSFRGGAAFRTAGTMPFMLQAILDFDGDFAPTRLVLALTVGGQDRIVGVATGARPGGSVELDGLTLAGISSRKP